MRCRNCGALVSPSDGITVDGLRLCDEHAKQVQLRQRAELLADRARSAAGGTP